MTSMILRRYLTTKQTQILAVVHAKNTDGTLLDLDQLLDALPYDTTKQSLHFSIRALMKRDYLVKKGPEKRRNRSHMLLELGPAGVGMYATVGAASAGPSFITDEAADGAESDLDLLI